MALGRHTCAAIFKTIGVAVSCARVLTHMAAISRTSCLADAGARAC